MDLQLSDPASDLHYLTVSRNGLAVSALAPGTRSLARACVALALVLTSCAPPPLSERAIDGDRPLSRLSAADSIVILVIEPSDCLACGGSLEPWVQWQQAHPQRVFIVLTVPATTQQSRELALRRLRPAGTLDSRWWWRDEFRTPHVALLVGGQVAFQAYLGDSAVAPLIRGFLEH